MARVRLKQVVQPSWTPPRSSLAPYRGRFARRGGLGALGLTASTSTVGAGASIGTAILPGVGTAIGAVLGLVAGSLLNKNYLNVAQANAGEDQAVAAFNQYRTIAGQVPGRQLGVPAMSVIWNGAVYSGLFPLNNAVRSFHEGALKYPGNPDWVYGTFYDGASNPFTFAYAYQQFIQARAGTQAMSANAGFSPQVIARAGVRAAFSGMDTTYMASSGVADFARRDFSGLGDALSPLNQQTTPPEAQPDAVTFIDQFFIPNSQRDSPPWAVPSSPLEHQILYDAADAYLATKGITTIPYVGSQPQSVTYPVALSASSTVAPGYYTNPTLALPGASPVQNTPLIAPVVTPLLPSLPTAIGASSGAVTSNIAATSANLDAALAAEGYTRVGTTPNGVPLYSQAGLVYAYQNGQLYNAGSVAQLATTGGAGTGISTPATGIDPNVLNAIAGAIQAGFSSQQAAQAGANVLAAQGVPITPEVQNQLDAAAAQPAIQTFTLTPGKLLIGGGILLLVLIARR